jgi:hypothetical protein
MGVVGSLPLPVSQPILNNTHNITPILNEQTISSSEEYSNDMLSVSYNIISNENINNDITMNNTTNARRSRCPVHGSPKRYKTVSYGPINVRVNQYIVPTLKTGRRSKFTPLEGEAAVKRELRRKKNREVARKLKEKRNNIGRQLENEITELESEKKDLLNQIDNLESYKQVLVHKFQENIFNETKMIQTESSTLSHVECHRRPLQRHVPIYNEHRQTKAEPRCPSPQWQLLFSI